MSTSTNILSATLAVGALALSVIAAGSAFAQTPSRVSVAVPVADLQPGAAGDAALAERIADAARKACGNVVVHSPLDPRAVTSCEARARDSALRQVERPTTLASAN
jgi:UrcA family protein